MEKVARNQVCPCGSGKKYKACCGSGDKTRSGAALGRTLGIVVAIVVVVGVAIAVNHFRTADLSADGATPEPWEYDVTRNMHYNPLPGHEHWHQGPPPDNRSGALPATGTVQVPVERPSTLPAVPPAAPAAKPANDDETPEDWFYDADNDRHWNPETATWDAGMPPLEKLIGN